MLGGVMHRHAVLDRAHEAVSDREKSYGSPKDNFGRLAAIANVILADKLNQPLNAMDIGMLKAAMKLARLIETPGHIDSAVDLAGYAALLSELGE